MATLEVLDLTKSFAATRAVHGLSLSLADGEFVSLLGPSGCGKSTTLALIAGFERPDHGQIVVDGRRIEHLPPRQRPVGVVLQDFAIFPRMSVAENIAFGLAARGVGRAERDRRITALAGRLRLDHLLTRRGRDLDLADMQRVAIARTLITEPKVLLLDEPLSSLDATVRDTVRDELKSLQAAIGQSVLYVTHDQGEAMALSDRIAVMSGGRILQIDAPRVLYERPRDRFVASFVGEPPINLVPAVLGSDGEGTLIRPDNFPVIRWKERWDGPLDVVFGVRPEAFEIVAAAEAGAVSATVEDVEAYGAVAGLIVSLPRGRLSIVTGRLDHRAGDAVALRLRPAGALLIDPESQRVLACLDPADVS